MDMNHSRGRRRAGRALALMLTTSALCCGLGLLLASCDADTPLAPVTAPLPYATHEPMQDVGGAEITGLLELRNGCLTVDGHPLSLPAGARWDDETESVILDGAAYKVGERVGWSGAYTARARAHGLPEECPPGEVAVVHTTSDP